MAWDKITQFFGMRSEAPASAADAAPPTPADAPEAPQEDAGASEPVPSADTFRGKAGENAYWLLLLKAVLEDEKRRNQKKIAKAIGT